jgi:hypothetical protein
MNKLENKFDAASFSKKIEEMVKFQHMDYLEAIMHFCEENGLEVEAVAALVKRSEPIRQKLEAQARASRVLGRGPVGATLDAFAQDA